MQALRAAPATTLQQQGSRRSPAAQRALVVPRASAEAQQAPQTDRRSALLALVAAGAALSGAAPQVRPCSAACARLLVPGGSRHGGASLAGLVPCSTPPLASQPPTWTLRPPPRRCPPPLAPQVALAGASKPSAPVGEYLPAAEGLPGFCLYVPDAKKTPAIRAGVIKPDPAFYRFAMVGGHCVASVMCV